MPGSTCWNETRPPQNSDCMWLIREYEDLVKKEFKLQVPEYNSLVFCGLAGLFSGLLKMHYIQRGILLMLLYCLPEEHLIIL